MILRALVVDDEELARERLQHLLAADTSLEVVGHCTNGPEAIAAIDQLEPDLIFLDVQMPEVDGFAVLRALRPEKVPAVIFVTAHDRHAVEAFEVHALDFLLKPFTQKRLLAAVQRARLSLQAKRSQSNPIRVQLPSAVPSQLTRVRVKSGNQTLFIKVEEIDYIESVGNYAVFATARENHVARETLTNLEAQLPQRIFFRISRSIIVNLHRVKAIDCGPDGESIVLLQTGRQLPLTRSARKLEERLQSLDSQVGQAAN